jgi:hypothetical protein
VSEKLLGDAERVVEGTDVGEHELVLEGQRSKPWILVARLLDHREEAIPNLSVGGASKTSFGGGELPFSSGLQRLQGRARGAPDVFHGIDGRAVAAGGPQLSFWLWRLPLMYRTRQLRELVARQKRSGIGQSREDEGFIGGGNLRVQPVQLRKLGIIERGWTPPSQRTGHPVVLFGQSGKGAGRLSRGAALTTNDYVLVFASESLS